MIIKWIIELKAKIITIIKPKFEKLLDCVKGSDKQPHFAIFFSAAAGLSIVLFLVFIPVWLFSDTFWKTVPWSFVTALAAAPSMMLLWYWRTVHKKQDIENDTKRITTDRFVKAVEQLGNEKVEIQVGGIYHLQKLMEEAPDYHWPIIQMLLHYIRTKSPFKPQGENKPITPNIQTAIDVICLRNPELDEKRMLDFSDANLSGVRFQFPYGYQRNERVNLSGAIFHRCCLDDAVFTSVDLSGARFTWSQAQKACFASAILDSAVLGEDAVFEKCEFQEANLANAKLGGSIFNHCDFSIASVNKNTLFVSIDQKKAEIDDSNFLGLYLKGNCHSPEDKQYELEQAAQDYLRTNRNTLSEDEISDIDNFFNIIITESMENGTLLRTCKQCIKLELLITLINSYAQD